jgi:multiple sugar transport system ATP-binding protein
MSKVKLVNLTKVYEHGVTAVKDITMETAEGEFVVLVGPSGSGKSTILRMIAGLEEVSRGEVFIDDVLVNDVSPRDRNTAMVFQDYALYPHMSVFDNIAFSLKMRKYPHNEIRQRVIDTARMLGIEPLLARKPKQISGGERQRVALGRAIVRNPKVFLMDEPLSNLDAKLRGQMRSEIYHLYRNIKTTVIYVTHDQTEAMTMGTRIVVLKEGVIQQIDTPREVYNNPANTHVASFIGTPPMNLLHGRISSEDGHRRICFPQGFLDLLPGRELRSLSSSDEVIVGIRPEHIKLSPAGVQSDGTLAGEVDVVELTGAECCVSVTTDCGNIVIRVPPETPLRRGENVGLRFQVERVHLFDSVSGKRLINAGTSASRM